ncbi:DUF2721 domain-containing protein [Hydrogenovibrio sp. JE_KL2]|uniref:DUF2721 domain-containing protein n=1 Tax=Hydrogenovibrio sp. JE_KL2 TaxID=2651188 RepID=UPI00128D4573|nr:DUF2721 domain-containing protein [Hydrogenovibrio sp. JE_KL2]MPQ77112.1 DUF2721 domain-containing protein [Hydrogenovibrio sp. JE_KL2]
MIDQIMTGDSVNVVSHFIQLSVAPVFLLAGVSGLLNVLVNRLNRIKDKVESLENFLIAHRAESPIDRRSDAVRRKQNRLHKRSRNVNLSILFCTMTGLWVALVIMVMFLSTLFSFHAAALISILFVFAMFCLIVSLLLFLAEIFMASKS